MNTEELELLSDSKYRNYVAAVDKALKNFEYSSEWADLISIWEAEIPHALRPKNQNIKQKKYCNKFNKDLKIAHIKKTF